MLGCARRGGIQNQHPEPANRYPFALTEYRSHSGNKARTLFEAGLPAELCAPPEGRGTQGIGAADECSRAALLFGYFLLGAQEKVPRPNGRNKKQKCTSSPPENLNNEKTPSGRTKSEDTILMQSGYRGRGLLLRMYLFLQERIACAMVLQGFMRAVAKRMVPRMLATTQIHRGFFGDFEFNRAKLAALVGAVAKRLTL
jgi:hypothetical protein